MKNEVYNRIKRSSYKDISLIGLAGLLKIDSESVFKKLTKALHDLTQEGLIYRAKDGYYEIYTKQNLIKGTFD